MCSSDLFPSHDRFASSLRQGITTDTEGKYDCFLFLGKRPEKKDQNIITILEMKYLGPSSKIKPEKDKRYYSSDKLDNQ